MPLTDDALIELLNRTIDALQHEAAWLIDADVDDYGRSRPSIPLADRDYFDAVTEEAAALRGLVEVIRERQKG